MNDRRLFECRQRFTTKLLYRNVELRTAADVVQFSIITRPSICGLDLELSQSYQINNDYRCIRNNYPSLSYSKCFISSEEKCRKVLSTSRHLLYTLHLDLPKERDWSLRNLSRPKNLSYYLRIPHIAKIHIGDEFYVNLIYKIVDFACENTHHGLKVLKWFIKFDGFRFHELPDNIINHFVDCMHPGISDADFVIECFMKVDFINWLKTSENPGRVENLLYQFHRFEWILEDCIFFRVLCINFCLLHRSFAYVSEVLKYVNEPLLCDTFLFMIAEKIFNFSQFKPSTELMEFLLGMRMNRRRSCLLLYLYWCYLNRSRNLPAVSQSLRIMWNSIPEAFLRHGEIASAFKKEGFSTDEVEDIYKFYCEAVDGFPTKIEPRSLKHYCRIVVRRRLWHCGLWLPDGIRQCGLPPKIQKYLNIEKLLH